MDTFPIESFIPEKRSGVLLLISRVESTDYLTIAQIARIRELYFLDDERSVEQRMMAGYLMICDECEMEPGSCDHDMEECEQEAAQEAAEVMFEARRDSHE